MMINTINLFNKIKKFIIFSIVISNLSYAENLQEFNSGAFDTQNVPLAKNIHEQEKTILIDPNNHVYGAYNHGKLIRWGIATTGSNWCRDINAACKTSSGTFRIYSVGNAACTSGTFPYPDGGAAMPYCMFFHGGQAIHGSDDVQFDNVSHGCVRVHRDDAKWLHDHFVEQPAAQNQYRGTLVMIRRGEGI